MDESPTTELRFRIRDRHERDRAAIRQTLVELPGVEAVRIHADDDLIVVVADRQVISDDELLAAIGANGLEAERA